MQVQLAESSVVTGVERNLAKWVGTEHCTAGVLFGVAMSLTKQADVPPASSSAQSPKSTAGAMLD